MATTSRRAARHRRHTRLRRKIRGTAERPRLAVFRSNRHIAVQLIKVGEESGQLEEMLLRVADIYDEEVKRTIQRLLGLLVPVITIGLGIVVAFIVGSMLAAIMTAYDLPL